MKTNAHKILMVTMMLYVYTKAYDAYGIVQGSPYQNITEYVRIALEDYQGQNSGQLPSTWDQLNNSEVMHIADTIAKKQFGKTIKNMYQFVDNYKGRYNCMRSDGEMCTGKAIISLVEPVKDPRYHCEVRYFVLQKEDGGLVTLWVSEEQYALMRKNDGHPPVVTRVIRPRNNNNNNTRMSISVQNKDNPLLAGEPICLGIRVESTKADVPHKTSYVIKIKEPNGERESPLSEYHLLQPSRRTIQADFQSYNEDKLIVDINIILMVESRMTENSNISDYEVITRESGIYEISVVEQYTKKVSNKIVVDVKEPVGKDNDAFRIFISDHGKHLWTGGIETEAIEYYERILNEYADTRYAAYAAYIIGRAKYHYQNKQHKYPENVPLTDRNELCKYFAVARNINDYSFINATARYYMAICSVNNINTEQMETIRKEMKKITDEYKYSYSIEEIMQAAKIVKEINDNKDIDEDYISPVLNIVGGQEINHECRTAYTDAGATASDNKDGDLTSAITVQNNVNASTPGSYTVVYTVSDAAGNTASATRTVNVVDTTAPTLTCLNDQVVVPTACGGAVHFDVPIAHDQCDGNVEVLCEPASGSALNPGIHAVTCTATDSAGNLNFCAFTVDVKERLQVRFVSPLEDDNTADNIETDADVVNQFKVGSRVVHKVKLFDCAGNDVTAMYAPLVTVRLDMTRRTTTNAGTELVHDVPEDYSGVGNAGGLMIPVGGQFQYNLDTTGYVAGTVNDGSFYRSHVTVEWVSAPGVVVGEEDALLESK